MGRTKAEVGTSRGGKKQESSNKTKHRRERSALRWALDIHLTEEIALRKIKQQRTWAAPRHSVERKETRTEDTLSSVVLTISSSLSVSSVFSVSCVIWSYSNITDKYINYFSAPSLYQKQFLWHQNNVFISEMTKQLEFLTCQIAEMINTTLGSISNQCKDMTCVCCQSKRVSACSLTWFHDSLQICVEHRPF